tara:strand:+ start:1825 stop:2955 length:1131 start_codon:yes stop_codon:yes gene_type:complete
MKFIYNLNHYLGRKHFQHLAFYIIPAGASFINLMTFLLLPMVTDFGEFELFVQLNVIAGFYLHVIAQGAHNISVIQTRDDGSSVFSSYQWLSLALCIITLIYSLFVNDLRIFGLVVAYLIQQQIICLVIFLRDKNDGVREKIYLLLQPALLFSLVLGLDLIGIKNSWIIAYIIAALISVTSISICSKFSLSVLIPRYWPTFSAINKVFWILSTSAFIPIFIHLDSVAMRNSDYLAEYIMLSKFIYSIPLSLCSLIIFKFFKEQSQTRITDLIQTIILITALSFCGIVTYMLTFTITLEMHYLIILFYILCFTTFNIIVSLEVLRYPLRMLKVALVVIAFLILTATYQPLSFTEYFLIKIICMCGVIYRIYSESKKE